MRFPRFVPFVIYLTLNTFSLFAQSPNGNINGLVSDPSSAAVLGAEVVAVNDVTGVQYITKTNSEGIYVLPNLPPGPYRLQVSKIGFKTMIKPDIVLNVQDALSVNFTLPVGAFHEVVTVQGGVPLINTENAAVGTVVDRQFAENLPMNGRSFQTLIELVPGVVTVPTSPADAGQFSVDGQRANANYWTVDGVSANVGISATNIPGSGLAGSLGAFSAFGGTNSLVSVDAMQEFKIQTSSYAPEFGRSPGAQISIVTRSGVNQFHGTAFDYLRNDVFDANDWFADFARLAKPKERQNDFGGTFSGPLIHDRTFFFLSYEGLRLRLPQVALDTVPDESARQLAVPAIQPYLNAFPLDPGQPDLGNGVAQYNASYSNAATLDAYSLRLDHRLTDKWSLSARYNYSPSKIVDRGANDGPLSVVAPTGISLQTLTVGMTTTLTSLLANEFHFNVSRTDAASTSQIDNFGGATPLSSFPFPSSFTLENSSFLFGLYSLKGGQQLSAGRQQRNDQRQLNFVDSLSIQQGRHSLKVGFDYRRLTPSVSPPFYLQNPNFLTIQSAESGTPDFSFVESNLPTTFLFRNLGVYGQDAWHITPALVVTYGARWDIDFTPRTLSGPDLAAVTGYDLENLEKLALAPRGVAPFSTRFANLAPRVGVSYQLQSSPGWETVLRGGAGIFYDLASSVVGTSVINANYPFGSFKFVSGVTFPFETATAAPTPISAANLSPVGGDTLYAFNPHLQSPYTIEWNAAIEQALGKQQSLSLSYVGSGGRQLLQSSYILSPNPSFYAADLVDNTAKSDYHALQVRFQRRVASGLQALTSYTWAHSIDNASSGSSFLGSNLNVPALGANINRGPSDFDIRNAFTLGTTYDLPSFQAPRTRLLLQGWAIQNFVVVFSASPVEASYNTLADTLFHSGADVRPDVVPGQDFYLHGSDCVAVLGPPCAGGKGFNPMAFVPPPIDSTTGNPLRQGDLGRNALRGFGAVQWDFAVHREFLIHERWKLQFRAELFNILNHPNFGQPVGALGGPGALNPQFGQSQAILAQALSGSQYAGSVGNGSLSSLYQMGAPRSIQFALKLMF
jgi:hypothetical protein